MTTPTTLPSPLVAHLTHDLATASWVVFVLLFGPPILRLLFGKHRRRRRRHGPLLFGPPDYDTYIASAAWRRKCDRFWRRHGRRCQWPGCHRKATQVHHLRYDHFGRERDRDLAGLCAHDHARVPKHPHPPYLEQAIFFGIKRRPLGYQPPWWTQQKVAA